jgi:hypothetical protein
MPHLLFRGAQSLWTRQVAIRSGRKVGHDRRTMGWAIGSGTEFSVFSVGVRGFKQESLECWVEEDRRELEEGMDY